MEIASPSTPRVSLSSQLAAAQQEIAQLKAENERLRAELEKLAGPFFTVHPLSFCDAQPLESSDFTFRVHGRRHLVARPLPRACIPAQWIEDLADCYESGYDRDSQTIYYRERMINQYEGIRDVDLAIKLGEYLGVNVSDLIDLSPSRARLVVAIRQAIEEE